MGMNAQAVMHFTTFWFVLNLVLALAVFAALVYLFALLVRALKRYINAKPAGAEQAQEAKSLGEVLKLHRTQCGMTQQFVAEALGVSRQAVSKWESGSASPSTANLMALAKLFDLAPEELLKEARG